MKPKDLIITITIVFTIGWNWAEAQTQIYKFAKIGSQVNSIEKTLTDSSGNLYVIGNYNSEFTYQGKTVTGLSTETGNIFILKTSPLGKLIWLHSFKSTEYTDWIYCNEADVNDKGELVAIFSVYGDTVSFANRNIELGLGESHSIVAKFTKNGYLMWSKVISAIGGFMYTELKDIKLDEKGDVYLAGNFQGDSIMFDNEKIIGTGNGYMVFVAKYSANGNVIWASSCASLTGVGSDYGGGVKAGLLAIENSGKVYLAGIYNDTLSYIFNDDTLKNDDLFSDKTYLATFSADGNPLGAKSFIGDGNSYPQALYYDKEGNIIFALTYSSTTFTIGGSTYTNGRDFADLIIAKLDTVSDNFMWSSEVKIELSPGDVMEYTPPIVSAGTDEVSNVILVGQKFDGSYRQIFFSKLDKNVGIQLWDSVTTGIGDLNFTGAIIDKNGNSYIGGSIGPTNNFSFAGKNIFDATGLGMSFLIKMKSDGDTAYIKQKQNILNDSINFLTINADNYGNVFLAGLFRGSSATLGSLDLGALANSSITKSFIAKYSSVKNISGNVVNTSGTAIQSGDVILIGYTYYQRSPFADTAIILPNGNFEFQDVPFGEYILLAMADDVGSTRYSPTYAESAAHWVDATRIIVSLSSSTSGITITVPELPAPIGTNGLSGRVTEVDSSDFATGDPSLKAAMKKPKAGGKAHLARSKLKTDYEIIATTETDENGDFSFTNVEDDTYIIIIEVAGLPVTTYHEVTVTGGMYVSNINYFISEEDIVAEGDPLYPEDPEDPVEPEDPEDPVEPEEPDNTTSAKSESNIKFYPNPGKGVFNLYIPDDFNLNNISILDIGGNKIYSQSYYEKKINLSNIESGIYFVTITTDKEQRLIKLMIE